MAMTNAQILEGVGLMFAWVFMLLAVPGLFWLMEEKGW